MTAPDSRKTPRSDRTAYRRLQRAPKLGAVRAVLTDIARGSSFRLPLTLLREADIEPVAGVRIELLHGMALIREARRESPCFMPSPRAHDLFLRATQLDFNGSTYSAAVGNGFVLLGEASAITALARGAPQFPYRKPDKSPVVSEGPARTTVALDGLVAWKDISTVKTRKLYASRSAKIEGAVLSLARLPVGSWLHVERQANATVVALGPAEGAYMQLRAAGRNRGILYAGPHIFNMNELPAVRVLIFDRKFALVRPDSLLAQRCPANLELHGRDDMVSLVHAHALQKQAALEAPPRWAQTAQKLPGAVAPRASHALRPGARSYPLRPGVRLQLRGAWLEEAGINIGGRYDVRPEGASLVVRAAAAGEFAVTASAGRPKLYVPARFLEGVRGRSVDVTCVGKSWVITPQQGLPLSPGRRDVRGLAP